LAYSCSFEHVSAVLGSFEHVSAILMTYFGSIHATHLDADSMFWHILAVFGVFLQFWVCFCSFEHYLALFGYLKSPNPNYHLPKNVLETRIATRTKSETNIRFLKILRDIFSTRNCYIFGTQNLSKYEPTNFI